MALIEQMKKVSQGTADAAVPAGFLFGEVMSVRPLSVRVDGRFTLPESALTLLKGTTSGDHTHAIAPHVHTVPQRSTETVQTHAHAVPQVSVGETGLVTNEGDYMGLAAGDRVVLLRNPGGQQYLILGKV